MGDMGEIFRAMREHKKETKQARKHWALQVLDDNRIEYQVLSENGPHLRLGEFDFWPSTGVFVHRKIRGLRGVGVKQLMKFLEL